MVQLKIKFPRVCRFVPGYSESSVNCWCPQTTKLTCQRWKPKCPSGQFSGQWQNHSIRVIVSNSKCFFVLNRDAEIRSSSV